MYKILKEGSYYADITDKTVHTRNFYLLFETMMFFHHYEKYLRNMNPTNIITNMPIKTLTEDQYDAFELYLIDYSEVDDLNSDDPFNTITMDHSIYYHP